MPFVRGLEALECERALNVALEAAHCDLRCMLDPAPAPGQRTIEDDDRDEHERLHPRETPVAVSLPELLA